MKRVVLFVILAVLTWNTGAQAQPPALPNVFPTLRACNEALRSGYLRFYEPRYYGLKTRNPVNHRDRVVVPLESDTCLEMLVVGGRRFIAQREGTLFRAQRLADGSLSLYARDDCGNPVYGVIYPPPEVPVIESPKPIAPRWVPEPGPMPPPVPVMVPVTERKKGGFCSSTKCKVAMVAIGGAAAGYAVWRFWPCPPGTVHR